MLLKRLTPSDLRQISSVDYFFWDVGTKITFSGCYFTLLIRFVNSAFSLFLRLCLNLQSDIRIISVPFPDGGEAEALSRAGPEFHAEDVPQVLLPVGLLVPEDTQADTLGGQTQNANGFIVGGLPQVYAVHLGGTEERWSWGTEIEKNLLVMQYVFWRKRKASTSTCHVLNSTTRQLSPSIPFLHILLCWFLLSKL